MTGWAQERIVGLFWLSGLWSEVSEEIEESEEIVESGENGENEGNGESAEA